MVVVIHLGGQKPSRELAQSVVHDSGLIIAADSGYDLCMDNDLRPQFVTGDFDSIDRVPDDSGIQVVPASEQTATDFEKALRLVPPGTTRLVILGGTGLRSDHFLTNLLIASALPAGQSVQFLDDLQSIHRVTPECGLHQSLPVNTILSLIPFSDCSGVTTSGLQWDLNHQDMGPGVMLGQSNRTRSGLVSVSVASGRLFVVANRSFPR